LTLNPIRLFALRQHIQAESFSQNREIGCSRTREIDGDGREKTESRVGKQLVNMKASKECKKFKLFVWHSVFKFWKASVSSSFEDVLKPIWPLGRGQPLSPTL